jgi:diketogulonate reductase-like aldo/keto reductase
MKNETLFDGNTIDKIGYGTWKIGGGTSADPSRNEQSLAALASAIELGYRHFDTAEYYASGNSERLIGQAVRDSGIPRAEFFITTKVKPTNLGYESTRNAFQRSLENLEMEYVDLYLIHWPRANMPLAETFRAFNELVSAGSLRYVGVSNFSVAQMKEAESYSDVPLLTNQAPYSVANRRYVHNGVLAYCQEKGILLTAYSPVEEGRLGSNQILEMIAKKHSATIYQIALAWLVQQPGVITIPMSFDPQHQQQNYEAAGMELTSTEMEQITNLSP